MKGRIRKAQGSGRRAQGTGHRAQRKKLRAQGTVTDHASRAGHASLAGRANCTRPARQQDTLQDKAKVASDGSPPAEGLGVGSWFKQLVIN